MGLNGCAASKARPARRRWLFWGFAKYYAMAEAAVHSFGSPTIYGVSTCFRHVLAQKMVFGARARGHGCGERA
jgi:hypothetical protein